MNDTAPAQAALWKDAGGRTWVEMQPILDRMLAPFLPPLLDAGAIVSGDRVLDVGCGAGASTLAIARAIGPTGAVTGIDISPPLVAAALGRATAEDVANADFIEADAQTHDFPAHAFDVVVSRFGVMFFDDPVAAFANLRRAARPDGRLAFVAWRGPAENPFMTLPGRAAAHLLPPPAETDPDAPGQFAFARKERIAGILGQSGWRQAGIAPLDLQVEIAAPDLDAYVTRMGTLGQQLAKADAQTRAMARQAVLEAVAPHLHQGAARFTCACWLVTAIA